MGEINIFVVGFLMVFLLGFIIYCKIKIDSEIMFYDDEDDDKWD